MTQLSDLFLTEKEKTLILLAIDSHMYSMHQNGCSKAAVDIFGKLEDRISMYNTKDAELIMHGITQLADEADEKLEDEDDPSTGLMWEASEFVAALTEDDAVEIYEALCERLGDDADEQTPEEFYSDNPDVDAFLRGDPKPTITEQLKASLEMEVNPNGPTSTEKLGIKGDHTPWYDRLPCDTERVQGHSETDLEGVIKNHLRTVK